MRHLFLPLLLATLVLPAMAAPKDPEADLRRVRQRIGELQQAVRDDLARRDKLAGKLRATEEDVAAARRRLDEVRERIRESDRRLQEIEAERQRQVRRLEDQRERLAAELRAAYMSGREEHLKLLLSQQDPAALGRMFAYYSYFGRARAALIIEIGQAVGRVESLVAAQGAQREILAGLERDRVRELAAVDAARAQRQQALAGVQGQIRSNRDTIAALKREAQALEQLVRDLRRALESMPAPSGQPFERVRGRLPWPVPGRIVAGFGQPRGGGLKWNGVLIATERGTEVRAPYAARVVYSDWLPGLGLLMILDHGGGYMTLYGHNEQLYKGLGEAVAAGEVIATVGDSGGQSRPELYLEVRKGTVTQDPRGWFRGTAP